MTQEPAPSENSHPGEASIKYVNKSLKALAKIIKKEKISSLALPKLATGVGGLDWEEVLPLIKENLGDLGIPVVIYTTYAKDVEAEEGL